MGPAYAKNIGVNIDDLLVSQPDTGEQALEITELLIRSGAVDVIAVDSVAALTPKAEIEGEMGHSHVGLQKCPGLASDLPAICPHLRQVASLAASSRDPFMVEEGREP